MTDKIVNVKKIQRLLNQLAAEERELSGYLRDAMVANTQPIVRFKLEEVKKFAKSMRDRIAAIQNEL